MNTYTKLLLEAAEQITKCGGNAKIILSMPLCDAIETLEKNGVLIKLVSQVKAEPEIIVEPSNWISNVGWNSYGYPYPLCSDTKIEVKKRNGNTDTGIASDWVVSWKETHGCETGIVAYRILNMTDDEF